MKTVLQALKDEVHYKLSSGFFENRLLERSLDGNEICTIDILKSKPFKGAVADCLMSLIQMPNFTEGDVSLSLSDKDNILTLANGMKTQGLQRGLNIVRTADGKTVKVLN